MACPPYSARVTARWIKSPERIRCLTHFHTLSSYLVEKMNALRNGLAHSFFPEDLRKSKPEYKGKSIFTLDGLKTFMADMSEVTDFFVRW
jgi:hypothetical protein